MLLLLTAFGTSVALGESCNRAGSARVVETEIDGPVEVIEWIRKPDGSLNLKTQAVFVITSAGSLYRSGDEGQSWSQQTRVGPVKAVSRTNNTDMQWFYNPVTGRAWTTDNQGLTYTAVAPDRQFVFLQAHPTLASTALAIISDNSVKNLYVTTDFGATWHKKHDHVEQAEWGSAGQDGVPEGNIIALVRAGSSLSFVRSKDYFATTDYTLTNAVVFLFHKKVVFIVRTSSRRGLELWSSVDGGQVYSRALFPNSDQIVEKRYTILDLDEGEAFVNVDLDDNTNYGTTFGSDRFDREFSEVLRYNKRDPSGRVDFRRVFGLEGIYVANRFNASDAKFAQTVLTFNKGADWKLLPAPAKDLDGKTIAAGSLLHLLGRTDSSKHNQLYSNEKAIGLVIANGQVGPYLRSSDKIGTYLSRDAGQSWIQIGWGSHTFEIANHGAITLFAEDSKPITDLKYSWTQGASSAQCSFTSRPMTLTDIATEPDNTARTFIMYGTRDAKGVLVHVDFNRAVRACAASDFENWSPLGDKCLLGEQFTYQRRKQDSVCVVSDDHQPSHKVQTCPCVEEDYECDFCYEPVGARPKVCKKVCDEFDPTKEPLECIDTWFQTKGYRLVPGNKCDRESDVAKALEPTEHTCSSVPDSGSRPGGPSELSGGAMFGIVLVVLFILGGGLVVAAVILSMINPQFREMAARIVPQRYQQFGGASRGDEGRPRASGAGYAKVGGSGSLLDQDDNSLEGEEEPAPFTPFPSSSSSSSRPTTTGGDDEDDDFNPRV